MKQEEKQLLLQDLCERLPYRVKIKFAFNKDIENAKNLIYVSDNGPSYIHNSRMTLTEDNIKYVFNDWLDECKPYLRPMSSMTEEEKKAILEKIDPLLENSLSNTYDENGEIKNDIFSLNRLWEPVFIEELTKRHFDYRGLIEKGLAIEAPKDMYNNKTE